MSLVTIFVYHNAFDANVAKNQLEPEGIPSYIFDDKTNNLHPDLSLALGGVKLKVNSKDLQMAQSILKLEDRTKLPDKCPFCSHHIVELNRNTIKTGFFATIFSLLAASWAAAAAGKRSYFRCTSCKETF